MKLTKIFTVTALALAGTAFIQTPASAQVASSDGDLILSFEVEGLGATSNPDYEVDLGSALTYATPGYVNTNISAFSVSDLNSIVSNSAVNGGDAVALTNSTVGYAIAGITPLNPLTMLPTKTVYEAFQFTDPKNSNNQTNASANIENVTEFLNGQPSASTTQGSLGVNNQDGFSYTTLGSGNSFGLSSTSSEVSVATLSGMAQTTTDNLYLFPQATSPLAEKSGVLLGTFTLNGSTGVLSYAAVPAAAVPEPSAYALGLCAMILFWVLKRRHSVA